MTCFWLRRSDTCSGRSRRDPQLPAPMRYWGRPQLSSRESPESSPTTPEPSTSSSPTNLRKINTKRHSFNHPCFKLLRFNSKWRNSPVFSPFKPTSSDSPSSGSSSSSPSAPSRRPIGSATSRHVSRTSKHRGYKSSPTGLQSGVETDSWPWTSNRPTY